MFFLQGVARFLFVPMAEAVMAAMVCSFIPLAHAGADARELSAAQARAWLARDKPPTRNPLVKFQRAFERRFERFPRGYRELLMLALAHRAVFVSASCSSSPARSR
jgi:multidrug efflux pump subunit AcrB